MAGKCTYQVNLFGHVVVLAGSPDEAKKLLFAAVARGLNETPAARTWQLETGTALTLARGREADE